MLPASCRHGRPPSRPTMQSRCWIDGRLKAGQDARWIPVTRDTLWNCRAWRARPLSVTLPAKRRSRRERMNDTATMSQRADALEEQMSRELDLIVIKSRLYSMAEGDMSPPP